MQRDGADWRRKTEVERDREWEREGVGLGLKICFVGPMVWWLVWSIKNRG